MTTEINTEKSANQPKGFNKKRKIWKSPKRRLIGQEVTYTQEELRPYEKGRFWYSIQDGQIIEIGEHDITVKLTKDGEDLFAKVKNEDLEHKDHKLSETIKVYVEQQQEVPQASEIKAIDLEQIEKTEKAFKSHQPVTGFVVGEIKGGYSVALFANNRDDAETGSCLRAFLPMGQASLRKGEGLSSEEMENPLEFIIADFNPSMGNIVVSRRGILVSHKKEEKDMFFSSYKIGDIVEGTVGAVMPYGLFINLGAVDGFLHISDIAWGKRLRDNDLPKVGEEVTAKIIEIDKENQKVKLSVKELHQDPWKQIERLYKPGTEVTGTIVAFADFGAFVSLQEGVEGLIHLGEISWHRIKHPSQRFKIGDTVKAAVLRVDKEAKRISLSTKALELSPVERLSAEFPIGAVLKTKIASIQDFGLFVELDKDTNGLVPRSEISWSRSEEPLEKFYSVGQEIEVAVLGFDPKRQRISCSIKRTNVDPWPKWKQKYRKGTYHNAKVIEVSRRGAECELEPGLTGFCPKGQLLSADDDMSKQQIKTGETIEVVISTFDSQHQKITLSQKAAVESETKKAYADYLNEQNKGGQDKTTLADALKKNFNKK